MRLLPVAPLDRLAANQPGCPGGRRRPKTKYEIGTIPRELTTATTGTHSHFGPRIWSAGRRLMSMRAAPLRMLSATAVTMISLRVPSLRSLHLRRSAMTSSLHGWVRGSPAPYLVTQVPPLLPALSSWKPAPDATCAELAGGREPSDIRHTQPVRHGTTRPGSWPAIERAPGRGTMDLYRVRAPGSITANGGSRGV